MKPTFTHNPLACALSLVAAGTMAPPALATDTELLEEIVVTAQRRQESLQDVAMSISAFTGDTLELRRIEGLVDLQFSVPNLVVDGLRTSIRGVGNNAISSTSEDGLGYHINDVYLNSPLFLTNDYFDIERVEVLRGPQGTLYGRNTTAGVINIHTRKPDDEFGGFASVTAGNYDTFRVKGAVNIPLNDKVRQRFSGMYLTRDGFTENIYTGNDVDGRDSYELRSSTSFDFSDRLSADLVVSYLDEDSNRSLRTKGVCTKDAETGCSALSAGFETPDVSSSIFQTINLAFLGGTLMPLGDYFADAVNPSSFRKVNMDQEPDYEATQLGVSLQFTYEFDNYQFVSLTGYYDTEGDVFADFDRFATDVRLSQPLTYRANARDEITTDLIRSGRRDLLDAEQFTQEFRLSSQYDGPFNFLLGAFYFDEERSSQTLITHPALAAGQQALGLPREFEFFNVESDPIETESYAIFGEGYFDLTERTRLTVGIRYTDDDKSIRTRQQFLVLVDPDWVEAEDDWQETTGKITLEHAITDDTMVYASAARGYKAGGLNPGGPEGGLVFDPEYINAFELGTKNTLFDGRLRANVGAFYYDYEDMQIGQITEVSALTVNGDATVMGAEAEFRLALAESWTFDLNLSWLDLEIDDFISADQGDPNGIAPGTVPARDENGDILFTDDGLLIKDLDGNTLRNAPEYSLNVGVEYSNQLFGGYDLTARADYFIQDDFYANEFNKPSDEFDGWEQLNLQLTLRPADGNWQALAYVKNAFDNDDVIRMNQDGPLVGRFRSATVLEPRNYGIELQYSF